MTHALLALYLAAVPGDWPFTSECEVTPEDLKGKSPFELRLMRNEIFARHGYIFKSDVLRLHFEDERWYAPTRENVEASLTPLEKKNIELLKAAEKPAAEAQLAALPEDLRAFYLRFRAAVQKHDGQKLAALTAFPFEHNVTTGDEVKVQRDEFIASIHTFFPDAAVEIIRDDGPNCRDNFCRLFTPRLSEDKRVGWAYVFQKKQNGWVLTGVYVLAG